MFPGIGSNTAHRKHRNCFDLIIFIVEVVFLEALSAIITFENTFISIPGLIIPRSVYDYMQSLFQNVPFAI